MFKTILIAVMSFGFCLFARGQMPAETNWERYAFQEAGFSVTLPKLPIVIDESNFDFSEESKRFGAYANGVAYVVSYSQEARDNSLKKFQRVEPFTAQNFQTRRQQIHAEFETRNEQVEETDSIFNDWQIVQFTGAETIYKLYFNLKTNDWIELWAIRPNNCKTEADSFLNSLKIEKKPQGRRVGDGASGTAKVVYPSKIENVGLAANSSVKQITLPSDSPLGSGAGNGIGFGAGSTGNNLNKTAVASNNKLITEKLRIVLKPRASYTEEARKSCITGTVRAGVTFSVSGAVTNVSIVSKLPFGLSEQAALAASKILFVPEKRNGAFISVNKVVEYNFNLY